MKLSDIQEEAPQRMRLSEVDNLPSFEMPKEDKLGEVGRRLGATAYGAAAGIGGGLGELEKFAAYELNPLQALGLEEKGKKHAMPFGRETVFPTMQEVEKGMQSIGIPKPQEKYSGWKTAGEVLGPMATLAPSAARGLLGIPSQTSATAAREAEKLGFKLRPAQVRQDESVGAVGAVGWREDNQQLANRLASKTTGKEAKEIDDKYIRSRLNELGSDFDRVYKGQQFTIDQPAVQALEQIRQFEQLLPPSTSLSNVRKTVENVLANYRSLIIRPGAQPQTFAIEGDALQTIRNDLMQAARSATDRSDAHRIYELIDTIDDSIARNHPQVAAELNRIRPLYRNTVVLEDLMRSGGIQKGNISLERLGNLLGAKREGVRRIGGELDQLGRLGRELKIRSRAEATGATPEAGERTLAQTLGSTMGTLTSPILQTRGARAVQRAVTPSATRRRFVPQVPSPGATTTGAVAGQFQGEE